MFASPPLDSSAALSQRKPIGAAAFGESERRLWGDETFNAIKAFAESDADGRGERLAHNGTALSAALSASKANANVAARLLSLVEAALIDDIDNVLLFAESADSLTEIAFEIIFDKSEAYNSRCVEAATRVYCAVISDFRLCEERAPSTRAFIARLTAESTRGEHISDYVLLYSLANLLIVPGVTAAFLASNGARVLGESLDRVHSDLQNAYFALIAYWILSFEANFQRFAAKPRNRVVARVLDCAKQFARDKIARVAIRIFANLASNSECVLQMLNGGVLAFLATELRKNGDESLRARSLALLERLEQSQKALSSWELFVGELRGERLVAGPCHSEAFWREHAHRAEENDFAAVRRLVALLDAPDEATQAIACFDLGEFCRRHRHANLILERERGKARLMELVGSERALAREAALVAVQKLMLNNWQPMQ